MRSLMSFWHLIMFWNFMMTCLGVNLFLAIMLGNQWTFSVCKPYPLVLGRFLELFFDYFLLSIFSISEIPVISMLGFLSWSSKLIFLLFSVFFPLSPLKKLFLVLLWEISSSLYSSSSIGFLVLLSNCVLIPRILFYFVNVLLWIYLSYLMDATCLSEDIILCSFLPPAEPLCPLNLLFLFAYICMYI